MKKFNFKLDKLIKIREHQEKIAKDHYFRVLQKKVRMENENTQMAGEIEENLFEESRYFSEKKEFGYQDIFLFEQYRKGLELKINENNIKKEELKPELEKLRQELLIATRKKKVVEKIKEKQFADYKKKMNNFLIKQQDEAASGMYIRKIQEESELAEKLRANEKMLAETVSENGEEV